MVGAAFGSLSFWASALNAGGATAGGLFAASLVGLGGLSWIVPTVVFFVLSSGLTHASPGPHESAREEPMRRTQAQVLANGGVAWVALVVLTIAPSGAPTLENGCYAVFIGALAAAAADTWATELGKLAPSQPRSLRSGRPVPTGTSGAVSVVGTGASLVGAASVVAAGVLVNGALTDALWMEFSVLVGAGMLGMVADSVAGAFLQGRYRSASGEWTETPPTPESWPVRGWAIVGNNAVNFFGTTVGVGAALLGFLLVS